ncbi:MAG: DUF4129 domain-containing protein [Candidatus Contendobacter sp.]|nr:DUF4129 domain-containing protein [Candidatus Contendobacter sp.]MDS4059993.1 DUF4129 domain-containing protein [Candidatus Contendobacter sp.]
MRLDAVAAELRPRNPWEATDLGAAMLRRWSGSVYRAWFALALPLFVLLHLLCWRHWWLVPWLLWWLKPLLDRPPLYILGHALFGDAPDRRRFWRELPGLLRHRALAALTWRRFDPARSFHLPVAQLEGLAGKVRRQRLRDLGQPGRGPAVWLTVICVHLEIGLNLALLILAWMLIPDFVDLEWHELLDDTEPWGQLWLNGVSFCGMSLVEPLYVAAGFALYLNRRTWLEAWDLELGFRRLAARLAQTRPAAVMVGLALGAALWVGQPSVGFATDAASDGDPEMEMVKMRCEQWRARVTELAESTDLVQRALAETLRDPDLRACVVEERWRWRERPEAPPAEKSVPDGGLARGFAIGVEYALWFALGLLAAVVAWQLWRQPVTLRGRRPRRAIAKPAPTLGRNDLIAPPAADLGEIAWRLWTAGQPRAALRALYQGSLAGLATRHGVPVSPSATEEDCLRLTAARLNDDELLEFFRRLTRVWQATAYAHRPPDETGARALCAEWPRHFAAPAGSSP